MGFFGRVVNLARGSLKTAFTPADTARAAALDAELQRARPTTAAKAGGQQRPAEAGPASEEALNSSRSAPERDASGEIKRTL